MERSWENLDWITVLLVSCFFLLAFIRFVYSKRFDEFINLPFSDKYFLVQGKNDALNHPFNVLLFLIQVVVISLFIYLFLYKRPDHDPLLFVKIVLIYTVFLLVKMLIEKMVGALFSIEPLINNYLYHKLTYLNLFSLVLFLANILFFYMAEFTKTAIISIGLGVLILNIIFIFYSYRSHRSLIIGNFFYFILYLCTLEISPLVLLYKSVM